MVKKRLMEIVDRLKEMEQYEDTLIIFTADHGECFGPKDNCQGFIHNCTCEHVVEVKTNFYDRELDVEEPLLSKNIIRVWEPRWDQIRKEL